MAAPLAAHLPSPAPSEPPELPARRPLADQLLTILIVAGPPVVLGFGIVTWWGDLVSLRDVIIGGVLYVLSCLGIAVGYHRLFAHRAFTAIRPLKIALAVAGSTAVEGSVIGWVAVHRRHHRFSDRAGDPHSPHGHRTLLRGLVHAHLGWMFKSDPTDEREFARDLVADPDLVRVGHLWGVFAIAGLLLPFALGWLISGSVLGGVTTFLWAGVARMMLLHHVTWSVNSICHSYGKRPFATRDQSRNVASLAIVSMGESFHNLHHAYPQSARHGALPHQVDLAASTIRVFERLGWATDVHWPDPQRLVVLSATEGHRSARGRP